MHDATYERARAALSFLDYTDRETWVEMAMAIKNEFGDNGFDIWDGWGSQHEKHTASAAKSVWKSAKSSGGSRTIAIGTLFYRAKQAGWNDDVPYKKPSADEIEKRKAAAAKRAAEAAATEAQERAAAAACAQRLWAAGVPADDSHPYLVKKGVKAHGLRVGTFEVVDGETGEVKEYHGQLLIPVCDRQKVLHTLQAIDKAGKKLYLRNGAKQGHFHAVGGKPLEHDGRKVFIITEGYATGASIHEVTGHLVLCCFDTSNLAPVARSLRERLPDAIILFAADNDQWNVDGKGEPTNPGVNAARAAAAEVQGLVAVPQFSHDDKDKPTDFNDLHQLVGTKAVAESISEALSPPAPPDEPPPWDDSEDDAPSLAAPLPPAVDDDDGRPEHNGHFSILGYNRGTYYIFQHGKRQIIEAKVGSFGSAGLIELAPLNWWEMNFPGTKSAAIDTNAATEFIIRTAEKRGIFDTEKIRGRGAWMDDGRVVYHHGSHLSVDGQPVDVTRIESRFVYEMAKSMQLPGDTMLTDEEGKRLVDVMKSFSWSVGGSALLCAGWVALAPICGAIPWRPHLWMTGGAGSGKSTIAKFCHSLLKGTDVFAQGNSSEAGIRQRLRADARPVVMDESESNEESDARRVQSILGLIRQASTESDAETLKGTTDGGGMTYHIRSMFCLASIQVALKHKADIDRLTVLTLKSRAVDDPAAGAEWEKMRAAIYEMTGREDSTFRARLLKRSIDLLPMTLKNIDVFSSVGAEVFGNQRDGDQYGALLAGAWSLVSTKVATREQARKLYDSHNWQELRDNHDSDESQRALQALMEAHIRIKGGIELTAYELVMASSGRKTDVADLSDVTADAILQRYGMKVKGGYLVLANNSNELKRLMQGTTFETDLRGVLLRVAGADKNGNKPERFNGPPDKCIRIPLVAIVGADAPREAAF